MGVGGLELFPVCHDTTVIYIILLLAVPLLNNERARELLNISGLLVDMDLI